MTPPRGRHSLIALIALLRLPRSRISNLIVGHTGIWGSRDQLSIVFALRNESKIFFRALQKTEEDFAVQIYGAAFSWPKNDAKWRKIA